MRLRPKIKAVTDDEEAHLSNLVEEFADKKRVETIIGEAGGGYWELIENSTRLIQSVKPDMHYFYVNKAWREALGYTREEAAELMFLDIIHPDFHQHCLHVFQKLMSGEDQVAVEVDFISKSGEVVKLRGIVSCYFENGVPVATRGAFESRVNTEHSEKEDFSEDLIIDEELDSVENLFLEFHDLVSDGSGYSGYSIEMKDSSQNSKVVWK